MARRKTYEGITEDQYLKAIIWLEEGGTKKGACDILRVGNNKTMSRLIEEYLDRIERDKIQRAKKRKMPVTDAERASIIEDYLMGSGMSLLSDIYYRSPSRIHDIISLAGALLRTKDIVDPLNPPAMPDECMSDTFDKGQFVWSAKYGCLAEIQRMYKGAYAILVFEDGVQMKSYQPPEELGCLKHLEAIGVNLSKLALNENRYLKGDPKTKPVMRIVSKAVHESNKRK